MIYHSESLTVEHDGEHWQMRKAGVADWVSWVAGICERTSDLADRPAGPKETSVAVSAIRSYPVQVVTKGGLLCWLHFQPRYVRIGGVVVDGSLVEALVTEVFVDLGTGAEFGVASVRAPLVQAIPGIELDSTPALVLRDQGRRMLIIAGMANQDAICPSMPDGLGDDY